MSQRKSARYTLHRSEQLNLTAVARLEDRPPDQGSVSGTRDTGHHQRQTGGGENL